MLFNHLGINHFIKHSTQKTQDTKEKKQAEDSLLYKQIIYNLYKAILVFNTFCIKILCSLGWNREQQDV